MDYQTSLVSSVALFVICGISAVLFARLKGMKKALRIALPCIAAITFVAGAILLAYGIQDIYPDTTERTSTTETVEYPLADTSSIETVITGGGGLRKWKDADVTFSYVDDGELIIVVLPVDDLTIKVSDDGEDERVEITTDRELLTTTYPSGRENVNVTEEEIKYTVYVHINETP